MVSKIPQAHYRLDIEIQFVGPLPEVDNHAAPEVTPAHWIAVEAAQDVLRRHGYAVVVTTHSSVRVGTVDIDPLEIAIQQTLDGES